MNCLLRFDYVSDFKMFNPIINLCKAYLGFLRHSSWSWFKKLGLVSLGPSLIFHREQTMTIDKDLENYQVRKQRQMHLDLSHLTGSELGIWNPAQISEPIINRIESYTIAQLKLHKQAISNEFEMFKRHWFSKLQSITSK